MTDAVDLAKENNKAVHILGLLSPGGVHSHEEHIHAMVELAVQRGVKKVYLHAFLDGRDTSPRSAAASIEAMQQLFDKLGGGRFASIIGRYYAMDRDHRWPRIQAAYDLITHGKAEFQALDAVSGCKWPMRVMKVMNSSRPRRLFPRGRGRLSSKMVMSSFL